MRMLNKRLLKLIWSVVKLFLFFIVPAVWNLILEVLSQVQLHFVQGSIQLLLIQHQLRKVDQSCRDFWQSISWQKRQAYFIFPFACPWISAILAVFGKILKATLLSDVEGFLTFSNSHSLVRDVLHFGMSNEHLSFTPGAWLGPSNA